MLQVSIIALVCASLFAGAAGYITLVEHPARLRLNDAPLLAQWALSYNRALPIQSGLAIVGGAAGLVAWYLSGAPLWLFGSVILLANWPYTLLAIMPTNTRLKAIRPNDAGPESRALLLKWGKLHNVRSFLGAGSVLLFAGAMAAVGIGS